MKQLLSYQVIGILGCSVYLIILLYSSWQLSLYMIPCRWTLFSTRKLFHVFLIMYCALQIISLYNFCVGNFYLKWTFTCHLFAICCEVIAVSLVAILWSKTLVSMSNAVKQVIPMLLLVDGFLVAYTIVVCLDMRRENESFEDWTVRSNVFKNLLIVEPVVLVINGLCLAYLGLRIRNRLIRDPSWEKLPIQQKRMVLFRLIGTMVVCCSCFALRAVLQVYMFAENNEEVIEHPVWVTSTWLPSTLPACILTYTMRRTEVEEDDETDDETSHENSHSAGSKKQSNGRCASALVAAVARLVIPSSNVEPGLDGHRTSAPADDLLDSFDHVIAPLLSTTLLAEGEPVSDGRPSESSPTRASAASRSMYTPDDSRVMSGQRGMYRGSSSGGRGLMRNKSTTSDSDLSDA